MLGGHNKLTLMLALICMPLFAPLSFAAAGWAVSESDLYLWSGISIALCAAFIALAYMAAKFFGLTVLEAWSKIETQELFASAIIAVFCVGLIASVNIAAQFLAGEAGATDITSVAVGFLRDSLYADGKMIYQKLGDAYFNTAKVASYSYTAGLSVGIMSTSQSDSPASGMSPLVSEVGQAMDATANFMMLAASQAAFLTFFATASALMLPVGIFLRSFSLTRKIGGTVLAATIASAVIYPASFLLSKGIYQTYNGEMTTGASNIAVAPAGNPPGVQVVCNPYMQRFVQSPLPFVGGEMGWQLTICPVVCAPLAVTGVGFAACYQTCSQIVVTTFYIIKSTFPIIAYFGVLLPFANHIGTPNDLMGGYYQPLQQYALPAVAKYAVLSLVVFFIPLIIAMVMLRNLSITFGGEPQLYGITKLV